MEGGFLDYISIYHSNFRFYIIFYQNYIGVTVKLFYKFNLKPSLVRKVLFNKTIMGIFIKISRLFEKSPKNNKWITTQPLIMWVYKGLS